MTIVWLFPACLFIMTPAFDKLAEIQRELFVQHQQGNLFDRIEEDN